MHTSLGPLKVELYCDAAPKASENFLRLAAMGKYDKTAFHRNIKGFMVQGGDPTHTGKGGESAWEGGKAFEDEVRENLKFGSRGVLAMANSGKDTNKSQFFVTYAKQPHLNGKYTIFGRLIGGQETLDVLERAPVEPAPSFRPTHPIVIERVTIHANPFADPSLLV